MKEAVAQHVQHHLFVQHPRHCAPQPLSPTPTIAATIRRSKASPTSFDGRLHWFVPLALPIVAVVTVASVLVWLVARLSRRAPALVAAAVLFACGAGSVAVDLLVSAYLGAPGMSWSFVVLGAAVPLMLFLLYFHLRLGRRVHLERILHR